MNSPKSLSELKPGCSAHVLAISGGREARQKMMNLGLVPGESVSVIREQNGGPVLVKVNDTQIVVGRGMAEKVRIRTAV